jgi:hypothetical protein
MTTCELQGEHETSTEATCFVDSGCGFNAISEEAAARSGKTITRGGDKLRITLGLKQHKMLERAVSTMEINIPNVGIYTTPCFVMDIPEKADILLGYDFLSKVNPLIDWKAQTMISRGPNKDVGSPDYETVKKRTLHYQRNGHEGTYGSTKYVSSKQMEADMKYGQCDDTFLFVIVPQEVIKTGKQDRFIKQTWETLEGTPAYTMLQKYKDTVFKTRLDVGQVEKNAKRHGIQHELDVTDKEPISVKQFRLSPQQRTEVQDWTEEMLRDGVIQRSTSPYNSPIFCVKKPVGWRIVHDYRLLNAKTLCPVEPIPYRQDITGAMTGSRWFSCMDLLSGYYQLLLRKQDRPYTAFSTPDGHFEYVVTPMGLSGAPATFNRLVQSIFRDLNEYTRAFFDDIYVFTKSPNIQDHLDQLDKVLSRCEKEGLFVKLSKCVFVAEEIPVLGDFVGRHGIRIDPDKVRAISEWPIPDTKSKLKSFLGTVVYNMKFCKNYGALVAPLHEATINKRKHEKITLSQAQVTCFNAIKKAMCEAPILRLPDHTQKFYVRMDASDFAIGGLLYQLDSSTEREHPVAYAGRKLAREELNYDARERELLAVLYAMRIWRTYLLDKPFTVQTDHQSLQGLLQQKKCTRRLARWLEEIAEFKPEFEWIKGTDNAQADGLSRRADYEPEVPTSAVSLRDFLQTLLMDEQAMYTMYAQTESTSDIPTRCRDGYAACHKLKKIWECRLEEGVDSDKRFKAYPHFLYENDLLWFSPIAEGEPRLCVPDIEDLKNEVMFMEHDDLSHGHPGTLKTKVYVTAKYYWKNMGKEIERYVRTCEKCQRNKTRQSKPPGLLHSLPIPETRWKDISMDYITKLPVTNHGFNAIWVIVDRLTKRIMLLACVEEMTAKEAAEIFVREYQKLHGIPASIVSDRDTKFTSEFWVEWIRLQGSTQMLSTAFKPSTDGQSERCNRFIEDYLRNYISPLQDAWSSHLATCEFAFNARYHESIKMSPFEADLGYIPRSISDVIIQQVRPERSESIAEEFVLQQMANLRHVQDAMSEAQTRMKQYYDKNRPTQIFEVGDKVLLSTKNMPVRHMGIVTKGKKKLSAKYLGPYLIESQVSPDTYKLTFPPGMRLHPCFHTSVLRKYHHDASATRWNTPQDQVLLADGSIGHIIESILDKRTKKGIIEYFVDWQGQPEDERTWEPEENLRQAQGLLDQFNKIPANQKPAKRRSGSRNPKRNKKKVRFE